MAYIAIMNRVRVSLTVDGKYILNKWVGEDMDTLLTAAAVKVGKVLVADDDSMLRECISALLTAAGFEVIQAEDGLDALEKYRAHQCNISLVITDIEMPRLNGIETTKRLREIDPSVKVIVSSGSGKDVPKDVRPDAFLPKPYTGTSLNETVQRVLQIA